jgi:hypothetical protein
LATHRIIPEQADEEVMIWEIFVARRTPLLLKDRAAME